jgi:hypothetical protein
VWRRVGPRGAQYVELVTAYWGRAEQAAPRDRELNARTPRDRAISDIDIDIVQDPARAPVPVWYILDFAVWLPASPTPLANYAPGGYTKTFQNKSEDAF